MLNDFKLRLPLFFGVNNRVAKHSRDDDRTSHQSPT
jgi:hypothetical protein